MASLQLQPIPDHQIQRSLLQLFRDVSLVASDQKQLIDQVRPWIRSPISVWDADLCGEFLHLASRVVGDEMTTIETSGSLGLSFPEELRRKTDLLCTCAASSNGSVAREPKLKACGLWVRARLSESLDGEGISTFATSAATALEPIGLPADAVADQVKLEIVLFIARHLSDGWFSSEVIDEGQGWCRELLTKYPDTVSDAARLLGVKSPSEQSSPVEPTICPRPELLPATDLRHAGDELLFLDLLNPNVLGVLNRQTATQVEGLSLGSGADEAKVFYDAAEDLWRVFCRDGNRENLALAERLSLYVYNVQAAPGSATDDRAPAFRLWMRTQLAGLIMEHDLPTLLEDGALLYRSLGLADHNADLTDAVIEALAGVCRVLEKEGNADHRQALLESHRSALAAIHRATAVADFEGDAVRDELSAWAYLESLLRLEPHLIPKQPRPRDEPAVGAPLSPGSLETPPVSPVDLHDLGRRVAQQLKTVLPFAQDEHRQKNAVLLAEAEAGTASLEEPIWGNLAFVAGLYSGFMGGKDLSTSQRITVLDGAVWSVHFEARFRQKLVRQRVKQMFSFLKAGGADTVFLEHADALLVSLLPVFERSILELIRTELVSLSLDQTSRALDARLQQLDSAIADIDENAERRSRSLEEPVQRRTIRVWKEPFRTESDVNERLGHEIDQLFEAAVPVETHVRQSIGHLQEARRQYAQWLDHGRGTSTTAFLGSAVHAAAVIAERLLEADRPHDAFSVSNMFAEVTKMLLPRVKDRAKYEVVFERFVLVGCCAVADSWRMDTERQKTADQATDIEDLSALLEKIARTALGTYFRMGTNAFVRGRVDTVLSARVVSQALARHFDRQLRSLLDSNRPRVREYIRTNMPGVYRLKLPEQWNAKRDEWERLLIETGYEDVVRLLRSMGDLVDPDQVGQVALDRRDEIARAAARNDHTRGVELLADSARELRTYLYTEAQRLLEYREPPRPASRNERVRNQLRRAERLIQTDHRGALIEFQRAWQLEIDNLELLDWVAYLEAKTGNLAGAEQKLDQLRRKRAPKRSFATEWNLAVLKYDRKNEPEAYQLLVPLLDGGSPDENLVLVVLALSLKLDDRARFLGTVPRTMSLRYHPLAIIIAHEMKNAGRVEELLAQLLAQWRGAWELPSVDQRFRGLDDMKEHVVSRAIVEGQIEQLVSWLEKRTRLVKTWVPNYIALAEVLEEWRQDIDGAFRVLRSRLDAVSQNARRGRDDGERLKYQRAIDQACEDLLDLCLRAKRPDLGQKAYELAARAHARADLLDSFSRFAPPDNNPDGSQEGLQDPGDSPEPAEIPDLPEPLRDPRLAERLMWVNAGLTQIRNAHSYLEKSKEIEEFTKLVSEVSPHEAGEALNIIRNVTSVIETFGRTDVDNPEDRSTRRTLYSRATGYERDLAQLLRSGALSPQLGALITPYGQALQQVVGDLSRLAGVGPVLDVTVENPFLSLESRNSTLVLRVTDRSERPVTDVSVETVSESPLISIVGSRKRHIPRLESQRSEVMSVPIERTGGGTGLNGGEVTFAVSLRASAEGFPDVDLGIKKLKVPIKTFQNALGFDQIPKLFQEGPLRPTAPELFQGRGELLSSIRNSFYGGAQRERYFFDGIRRVGKTTILNFLPQYVPESVIPVIANFEMLGVAPGRFNSADVLRRFSTLIADAVAVTHGIQIDAGDVQAFHTDPGRAFGTFLGELGAALPGKVPLLMVDEFQELLHEIEATGIERSRDTLVLDQLRGNLDTGRLYGLFTGSVRFDRLTRIVDHRIFGSLARLPVSFLSAESVGEVLRIGLEQWAIVPPETVKQIHDLTGGYPWLVQKYGLALVDLLNSEHRTVVTPKDVEDVTRDKILWDDTLFEFWWPTDQLGPDEERFVEWILRKYPGEQRISIRNFFSEVGRREEQTFRRAHENLRAAEVLDSTQTEYLRFGGTVLRRWLEQQMRDGQLHIQRAVEVGPGVRGQAGIFIDHENLIRSLEEISAKRGVAVPSQSDPERVTWFTRVLSRLMAQAEERVGVPVHKVAVAFWHRPNEARMIKAYQPYDFQFKAPEETEKGNEVDFKLADEARRARERAHREGTSLGRAIIVTGDSDLSHMVRGLKNDGVSVQVWGGSRNVADMYISVVGADNFVYVEDVSGL